MKMNNLLNTLTGFAGIAAVEISEKVMPPDPDIIEAVGKLAIQIAIAIITIWQLLRKKK